MKAVIIGAFVSIAIMDIALPATDITDIRLVNGSSPNEGRVEYQRNDMWESVCGEGFNNDDAIVVCKQLGYPGVNNQIMDWTIGMGADYSSMHLGCNGDEDNLRDCGWSMGLCTSPGGVICYDRSYLGCFPSQLILTTACKTQYSNLTIDTCIRLCHHSNESYIYAGVGDGRNCQCGSSDLDLSKFTSSSDIMCNSKCTGNRLVDRNCGGMGFTAVFNVSLFLSFDNDGIINDTCDAEEESATGQPLSNTQNDTAVSTESQRISSETEGEPSSTAKTENTPFIKSSIMTTEKKDSTSVGESSSTSKTYSTIFKYSTILTTEKEATTERAGRVTTGIVSQPSNTAGLRSITSTFSTPPDSIGLYVGVGVAGGVLIIVLVALAIIVVRRSRYPKVRRGSNGRVIMELRMRPEGSMENEYEINDVNTRRQRDAGIAPTTDGQPQDEGDYSVIANDSERSRILDNTASSGLNHARPSRVSPTPERSPPEPEVSKRADHSAPEDFYSLVEGHNVNKLDTPWDHSDLYSMPDKNKYAFSGQTCGEAVEQDNEKQKPVPAPRTRGQVDTSSSLSTSQGESAETTNVKAQTNGALDLAENSEEGEVDMIENVLYA